MLHPTMFIRPDDIIRTGVIQPFSVRTMNPVQYARHEIDPFIQAIRPQGAMAGALGAEGDMDPKWTWLAGGVLVGIVTGWIAKGALKPKRQRRRRR